MVASERKENLAMKKTLSTALVASVIALVPAGAALADPRLPNARPHQHYIVTPKEEQRVPIGPDVCKDPDLQQAFNQFHFNVHHSEVRGPGGIPIPIDTLGPQHGAPGLHNDKGADMIADICPPT
jgi:hypothetical protein